MGELNRFWELAVLVPLAALLVLAAAQTVPAASTSPCSTPEHQQQRDAC